MRHRIKKISYVSGIVFGALLLAAVFAGKGKTQDVNWWTTGALNKVRPNDAPPSGQPQTVSVFAASNEFEPFQIVLRAGSQDLQGVDVQMSDLSGAGGASITADHFTIYFERYITVKTPSSVEGDTGDWPDPLIPKVDRYAGETRNAFPFTVQSGRNQPVWVELYVPLGTPPGTYSGTAMVSFTGLPTIAIPVSLTVWNFALPSTSSLKTSFGFSGLSALAQHRGAYTNDEELLSISSLYAKSALWHRISIHGGTGSPPILKNDGQIDWSYYDREMSPFLNGSVFSDSDPLPGAQATTIDLRTPSYTITPAQKISYWRQWVSHFVDKGWIDRLFYYVWDEPASPDFPILATAASLTHQADGRIRNLVTTALDQSLTGLIDIWVPLINCVDDKPGFGGLCPQTVSRDGYSPELQRGSNLWWYQSCESHGCSSGGRGYFTGWPSYVIDVNPVANRIMSWVTWKYNVQGELYYSMDVGFSAGKNPFSDVYLFGGNGDGTLFYPGRPSDIGGNTDIPVESIRLKLIREGLEDYEYINMLAKMGYSGCADEIVSRIVRKTYDWEHNPDTFSAARQQLGEQLNALSSASSGGNLDIASRSVRYRVPRLAGSCVSGN